ncbi:MAG: ATP-binding protein, partial [Mycobacteriales bacterium]
ITDEVTGDVLTSSSRAVALVAFLVAHAGTPQARQRISALFWPESIDAQALTNLRRELHHLRGVLGEEGSLVVTSRDLCWRDTATCRVDLRVFELEREAALAAAAADDTGAVLAHAAAAVAGYRGELLPGLYDDWVLEARAELERRCADLCDLLCAARLEAGDPAGAMEAARRRIQLQPLEESGYRTLMRIQADLGDRAGAISTYHHCASVLERELGVVPDKATRQALQRLMAGAGPPAGEDGTGPPPDERAGGRSGLAAALLVGRSRELGVLRDRWQAAVAGRPGLVLVRGGAGVGKSRLVAEVARSARQHGAVVVASQCFGTSGRLALAPVVDWLRHPAFQAAVATLDPAWRAEVARLVPSGGRVPRGAGSRVVADAWRRHRFFEGLARALLAAGGPKLLVLDNVQWCDLETLTFVTFFLGLAAGTPVLVAGTLRDDNLDEDPEVMDWVARMRVTGLLTEISVSPLELADTSRLAEAVSGRPLHPVDADLLQATTGGFPLYVVEAVRGSVERGRAGRGAPLPPDDLAAVLRDRLDQATAAAREVAGLAAAVGSDFTLDLLTEASDLEAGAVVGAVDELWRRRILKEFRDGYDFSHDMLREAAYGQVDPARRWLLHRRVAQAVELLHAGDTDMVSAQLAEQYARAGRPERAVVHYLRAADVAAGRFANGEAVRLHHRALAAVGDLPDGRDRDAQELAVLEAMAAPLNARLGYAAPELERTLERAIVLAESLGRTDSVFAGLVSLWATRFVQGHIADGYHTALRALALVDPDSEQGGAAHFVVGGSVVSMGRLAEGLRHLELAARSAGRAQWLSTGSRADVHSMAWAAHAHWLLGHDDATLASCRDAVALARSIDHPYVLAIALAYGGITHQMRHDLPALRETVGELRDLCDRYDFAYYREWALVLDGWSRDDAQGLALVRRGIANLRSEGSFARMPYWLSLRADLSARHGQLDAARATLDAALAAGTARDDLWWLPEVMRMRAVHDEDPAAAVARLRAAARTAATQGSAGLLRRCERDLAMRTIGERSRS